LDGGRLVGKPKHGTYYHAARPLLNAIAMNAGVAKIICFRCRKADCGCLAASSYARPSQLAWAFAWLGGACLAGTAVGAVLAFFFGG
jgi:hypothetical protein